MLDYWDAMRIAREYATDKRGHRQAFTMDVKRDGSVYVRLKGKARGTKVGRVGRVETF
jgi:hypothetical protein